MPRLIHASCFLPAKERWFGPSLIQNTIGFNFLPQRYVHHGTASWDSLFSNMPSVLIIITRPIIFLYTEFPKHASLYIIILDSHAPLPLDD